MSTPTQAKDLTLGDIDEQLGHWAKKLHTDPDPVSRWAHLKACDMWLDTRNALTKNRDQQPVE